MTRELRLPLLRVLAVACLLARPASGGMVEALIRADQVIQWETADHARVWRAGSVGRLRPRRRCRSRRAHRDSRGRPDRRHQSRAKAVAREG